VPCFWATRRRPGRQSAGCSFWGPCCEGQGVLVSKTIGDLAARVKVCLCRKFVGNPAAKVCLYWKPLTWGFFPGGGQTERSYTGEKQKDTQETPLPISLSWLECAHKEMWAPRSKYLSIGWMSERWVEKDMTSGRCNIRDREQVSSWGEKFFGEKFVPERRRRDIHLDLGV